MQPNAYALGTSASAARRLEIQDGQFASVSEHLLDALNIRPNDRVVELGCGAGSFSRRILRRLASDGVLVGVDYSQGLLDQASENLATSAAARFEPVLSDIHEVAALVASADVVVERTVLHHLAVPEAFLGRLRRELKPGARLGFIEPEFRALIARLAALESQGRSELAPLRRWAEGISRYYQACRLSPSIGATLARSLDAAGYQRVHSEWAECPTDAGAVENILLYYDEVREKYVQLGIMSSDQIDREQRLLASLSFDDLPPVWGMYGVTCQVD
jgi:ubiquinone/menaquinone biosynthesis C-methylase UbiE